MKNLFWNFTIFIALSVAFSSLTACPTATTQKGPPDESNSNTNTGETKKTDVDYPPAPSAIAQAEIKMLDGTTFKLEDQKGKVILFNLWATWCGPCLAEMPHLIEIQDKYRDSGFEIIGLDVGDYNNNPESAEEIEAFAKKKGLNYKLGWTNRELQNEFIKLTQMSGIPLSVLVNREGKVTGIFTGGSMRVIKSMKETVEKTINE
jgi:thiol-disulfide isomerase/thioredoxin